MTTCPTCNQPVPPDQAKVELDSRGLIIAASVVPGLGPPLIEPGTCLKYRIFLNGEKVIDVVAFDCKNGLLWRHQLDGKGNMVLRNGTVAIEKLSGKVTVEVDDG